MAHTPDWSTRAKDLLLAVQSLPSRPEDVSPDEDHSLQLIKLRREQQEAQIHSAIPAYEQRKRQELLTTIEKALAERTKTASSGANDNNARPSKFSFRKATAPARRASEGSPAVISPASTAPTLLGAVEPVSAESLHQVMPAILPRELELITLQTLFPDHPRDAVTSSISLTSLKSCILDLRGAGVPALYLQDLADCIVLAPSISGSVLVRNARNSTFLVGCHQFRIHTSRGCRILLAIPERGEAIVEDCTGLVFAPWSPGSPAAAQTSNARHLVVRSFDVPTSELASKEGERGNSAACEGTASGRAGHRVMDGGSSEVAELEKALLALPAGRMSKEDIQAFIEKHVPGQGLETPVSGCGP